MLGGTFDPIHNGHLLLADQAMSELGLEKVLFMPTGRPPHKDENRVAPVRHRVEMVRLAVADNPAFEVSNIESDAPGTSYTYTTLETLRARLGPDDEIYYLIGSDVLTYLTKFKHYRRVFDACVFAAATRPGADRAEFAGLAEQLERVHGARVRLLSFPEVDISSTTIRERLAVGRSVRYMLPDSVVDYIRQNGLFERAADTAVPGYWDAIEAPPEGCILRRDSYTVDNVGCVAPEYYARPPFEFGAQETERLKRELAAKLGAGRFKHTLGVMETAAGLAKRYGADPAKAALAGLLHDCMREMPAAELLAYCERRDIPINGVERRAPALLHGAAGAEAARELYGVDDAEILDAIRCHTTGREGMGLLAKLLFIADAVEPGRRYEAAVKARAMADGGAGPDEILLFLYDSQIAHIVETGRELHPATVHARNGIIARDYARDYARD